MDGVVKIVWSAPKRQRTEEVEKNADKEEYDEGGGEEEMLPKLSVNTKFLGRVIEDIDRSNLKTLVDDAQPATNRSLNKAEGKALILKLASMYGLRVTFEEEHEKEDARSILKKVDARAIIDAATGSIPKGGAAEQSTRATALPSHKRRSFMPAGNADARAILNSRRNEQQIRPPSNPGHSKMPSSADAPVRDLRVLGPPPGTKISSSDPATQHRQKKRVGGLFAAALSSAGMRR